MTCSDEGDNSRPSRCTARLTALPFAGHTRGRGRRGTQLLLLVAVSLTMALLLSLGSSWNCARANSRPLFSSLPVAWHVSKSSSRQDEVRNVIFVKVHKAASSTMFSIFIRFSVSRDLYVLFPREGNVHNETGGEDRGIVPHPHHPPFLFNILCHHILFNASQLRSFFPQDVRHVTMLRHPWSQIVSAFQYYKEVYPKPYLTNAESFEDYVSNALRFEPPDPRQSFTNNRQSIDLGLPPEQLWNLSHVPVFVGHVQDTFHLVLLVEHFQESLVLLKRMLGWSAKDVLFMDSNRQARKMHVSVPPEVKARVLHLNHYDVALYEHFQEVFRRHVQAEGPSFHDEVRTLTHIQANVRRFCTDSRQPRDCLAVKATRWSERLTVTSAECHAMLLTEEELSERVRRQQMARMVKDVPAERLGDLELRQFFAAPQQQQRPGDRHELPAQAAHTCLQVPASETDDR